MEEGPGKENHTAGAPREAETRTSPGIQGMMGELGRSSSMFLDPAQTSAWREKAGAFFSSSSLKIRNVASKAGTTVAEAAGGAGTKMKEAYQVMQPKMAEAATKASVTMKDTWETTRDKWTNEVAPKMEASISSAAKAAADTGLKLRQGLRDTTERVKASNFGQQLGDLTKAGVERSQGLLAKNEWRSNTMRAEAATDGRSVFGVPLEVVATRGPPTALPIPAIVVLCCDYLLENGLSTPYLFESEGDSSVVKRIMKGFDQEANMVIPPDTAPLDVAQLLLVYFKCLPEPVLTFRLYSDFAAFGGSDLQHLCRLLRTLPTPNLETLQRVLGLLHKVSLECDHNKMDAQSLAAEFAPVLLWKQGSTASSAEARAGGAAAAAEESSRQEGRTTVSSEGIAVGPVLLDPVGFAEPLVGSEASEDKSRVIMDVDGNVASAAEIPSESDQPTQEQTSLVEAIMVLIEQYDSIFSHSPDGQVMVLSDA